MRKEMKITVIFNTEKHECIVIEVREYLRKLSFPSIINSVEDCNLSFLGGIFQNESGNRTRNYAELIYHNIVSFASCICPSWDPHR